MCRHLYRFSKECLKSSICLCPNLRSRCCRCLGRNLSHVGGRRLSLLGYLGKKLLRRRRRDGHRRQGIKLFGDNVKVKELQERCR